MAKKVYRTAAMAHCCSIVLGCVIYTPFPIAALITLFFIHSHVFVSFLVTLTLIKRRSRPCGMHLTFNGDFVGYWLPDIGYGQWVLVFCTLI